MNSPLSRFEITAPHRIVFGRGAASELGSLTRSYGPCALVVTGQSERNDAWVSEQLVAHRFSVSFCRIPGEPSLDQVATAAANAREKGITVVLGVGGGSALDAAKAIAALATNPGDPLVHLEVVGKGEPLIHPPLPFLAVPTTAGTGAEATKNAVLFVPSHQVKVSLRSPLMLAQVALVDPALTDQLPPELSAYTGLDALTQLIEPYVCNRANPWTDSLCVEGLRRISRSLRRACLESHPDARDDMALASLFGGLALANAGLGAVHGFAGPAGGMFNAPHGAVCAALLPHVMRANVHALRESAADSPVLQRYGEVARLLTGRAQAVPEEGIAWVEELGLPIPRLGHWGIRPNDIPELVQKAAIASSMKANPVVLSSAQLTAIVEAAV